MSVHVLLEKIYTHIQWYKRWRSNRIECWFSLSSELGSNTQCPYRLCYRGCIPSVYVNSEEVLLSKMLSHFIKFDRKPFINLRYMFECNENKASILSEKESHLVLGNRKYQEICISVNGQLGVFFEQVFDPAGAVWFFSCPVPFPWSVEACSLPWRWWTSWEYYGCCWRVAWLDCQEVQVHCF